MGDLFSGTKKTTSTQQADTGPSKFQQPFLSQAFGAAQSNYNAQKDTPYFQGDTFAGMSPEQKATLDKLKGYATGQGLDTANQLSTVGQGLVGNAKKATDSLDQFKTLAGTDATTANIAGATRYAANPFIDGQIDAASRDVSRNLNENLIPGIDRAASGSGNINSSRAGVASGIAQRGAADRVADISAQFRGQAYDRGLTLAQGDRGQNLDALSTAARGYSDLTGQGISAIGQGADATYKAFGAAAGADSAQQQDRQGGLDAALEKWKGMDSRQWDLLNRYFGVVGSNQWGQSASTSGTGTEKSSGNILGQILGAASTGAAIFSDRRLKRSIRKIGESADGLGIYIYRYIWGRRLRVGVMADEVARLRPHALGPIILGFSTVRYGLLSAQ